MYTKLETDSLPPVLFQLQIRQDLHERSLSSSVFLLLNLALGWR